MHAIHESLLSVVAVLCAASMGLAIQRGGTCAVAAVQEWRSSRRLTRCTAMLEASLWVLVGLTFARHGGLPVAQQSGYGLSVWTLAGAVLLGLGAVLNRACAVGSVARFANGEWAFVLMPVGFFLGCIGGRAVLPGAGLEPMLLGESPALPPAWMAWMTLGVLLARPVVALAHRARSGPLAYGSPHAATVAIGVAFLGLLLSFGNWAYTDVLSELARGRSGALVDQALLGLSLLAGALVGGWRAGAWAHARVDGRQVWRSLAGGALMGVGSLLVPGGNDGLILLAMPLLWPYAWVSVGIMVLVIAWALDLLASSGPRSP